MKLIYIFNLFVAFLFIKCQNEMNYKELVVEDEKLYEVVYGLNKEQIISKHELNGDSIWNGESKEFYPNGSLKSLSFYNNGKIEGEKLTFYEDIFVKYFDFLETDTVVVEHQTFKVYEFYDKNEDLKFVRKYDEKGGIIKDKGSVFVLDKTNSKRLKIGEKFNGQFYLVNPPGASIGISVNVFKKDKLIKTKTLEIDKNYDAGFLEMPFNKPGEYIIEVVGFIDDTLQKKIKQDTLKYKVTVVNDLIKI